MTSLSSVDKPINKTREDYQVDKANNKTSQARLLKGTLCIHSESQQTHE